MNRRTLDNHPGLLPEELWQRFHTARLERRQAASTPLLDLSRKSPTRSWEALLSTLLEVEDISSVSQRVQFALDQNQRAGEPPLLSLMLLRCKGEPDFDTAEALLDITLTTARRALDHVTALDGEWFSVVLPNTDLDGARHVSEAIVSTFDSWGRHHRPDEQPYLAIGIASTSDFAAERLAEARAGKCIVALAASRVADAAERVGHHIRSSPPTIQF